MSNLTVPWREPMLDRAGNIAPPWIIFWNELITRVGGVGNVTDLAGVIALINALTANLDVLTVIVNDQGVAKPPIDHGIEAAIGELLQESQRLQASNQALQSQIEELRSQLDASRGDDLRSRIEIIEGVIG
jgi:uncharacterized protein YlxW (UPF0749 family)